MIQHNVFKKIKSGLVAQYLLKLQNTIITLVKCELI